MLGDKSEIKSGDQSTNNQAHTITNNYGLSYAEVREIATDVFKANVIQYGETAAVTAFERASEMTEKFLSKLEKEAPEAVNEFATPGMQDTYFQAQKAYAINGDEEIADMLVEMLVERAKSPVRNRMRMVLDEGLKIAPKLTVQQMDLLTLTHFRFHTQSQNLGTFVSLAHKLNLEFMLMDNINITEVDEDLSILEYLGLGKLTDTSEFNSTESTLLNTYPAYFCKGFTLEECHVPEISHSELFIPCFHDSNKFQFRFEAKEDLIANLRGKGITEERINYISQFFDSHLFQQHEISSLLSPYIPNFETLISMYKSTSWKNFHISKVGMAIGLSNYHRRYGIKNDLSIWVK